MKKLFCLLFALCSVCLVGCGVDTDDGKCDDCGCDFYSGGRLVMHFDENGNTDPENYKYELCMDCADKKFGLLDRIKNSASNN